MRRNGNQLANKVNKANECGVPFGPSFNHVELGHPGIPVVMNGEQDNVGHTNTFKASRQRPFLPVKGNRIFLYQNALVRDSGIVRSLSEYSQKRPCES